MRAPLATAIAIAVGLVILAGYFVPIPLLADLRVILVGWAAILAAVATLVAILNLFGVHWRRLFNRQKADIYSLFFLVSFVLTLAAGLWLGPASPSFQQAVVAVQIPVEASLMALVAVTLTLAGVSLFRKRQGGMAVIFWLSALLFILFSSGLLALGQGIPLLSEISGFLQRLPIAGSRGILLGVALGSLTAGLRVLFGMDRPYSG